MRYRSPDPQHLQRQITEEITALEKITDPNRRFVKAIEVGEMLTIVGREREAIELLKPYVSNSVVNASDEDFAWLYLNYATANQYQQNDAVAAKYFKVALQLAEQRNLQEVEHYVLHHYGRFLVEQEEYDSAKIYFRKAFDLRRALGDHRSSSTQMAMDSLEVLLRSGGRKE